MKCVMAYIHDDGGNVNFKNHTTGFTPLMAACQMEQIDFSIIKTLVNHGADVRQRDPLGQTPLHQIAKIGNLEILSFLLEHGADILAKDNQGFTPLINAVSFHHLKAVDMLVKNNASVVICEDCVGSLHAACTKGHIKCMGGWLDRGQNVNLYNYDDYTQRGKTPLMLACELGFVDCVDFLIQRGAKVNQKSRNVMKNTALIIAAECGHVSCVKSLLLNNANINDADSNKQTALIHASKRNHTTCVEALLDNHGADLLIKDRYEKDAFIWCSIRRFDECLKLLKYELEHHECKEAHKERMQLTFVEINRMGYELIQQEIQVQEHIHVDRMKTLALRVVETLAKDTAAMCMSICTPDHDKGAASAGYEEFYLKLPSLKASPLSTPSSPDVIVKNKRAISIMDIKERSKKLVQHMHQKGKKLSPPLLR